MHKNVKNVKLMQPNESIDRCIDLSFPPSTTIDATTPGMLEVRNTVKDVLKTRWYLNGEIT